jgi:type II secretory pathway component GspD/PulD (secretin)
MIRCWITCLLLAFSQLACAASPVSLSVENAPVRDILHSLSIMSGRSIIMPPNLGGTLTLNLEGVPFEEALQLVARSQGLCLKQQGNVIFVATPEAMNNAFGTLQVYRLNYLSAREAAETLKPLVTSPLSWDAVSNSLLTLGGPGEQARISEALKVMDAPGRQITLEAKILSLQEEAARELGLQWNWSALPEGDSDGDSWGGTLHLGHGYSGRFQAVLSALCQSGKAKVLATPRIITLPGKEGSIFIGDHIPVVTEKVSNGTTTSSTEYVDAGIRLSYTPVLSKDGLITAEVHTEVSTPTLISELKNYRITSRTADTHVRMKEKETLVIGGLISEEEQKRLEAVPLLSKLPLLGELFKFRSRKKNTTEVFMLLTPYISNPGHSPAIYGAIPGEETAAEKTAAPSPPKKTRSPFMKETPPEDRSWTQK